MNNQCLLLSAIGLGMLLGHAPAFPAEPTIAHGTRFESLTLGGITYQKVEIRTVSPRSVVITHTHGMASLLLRDLSPELQARFNFNPAAAVDAEKAEQEKAAALAAQQAKQRAAVPKKLTDVERLFKKFGTDVEIQPEVNLRPRFAAHDLNVKNQGRRPSCAIFAIVSTLEYQNAILTGHHEKFSEEYLLWAVRKSLNRAKRSAPSAAVENPDDADEGFTLNQVTAALKTYGIPPEDRMPYDFSQGSQQNPEPPARLKEMALKHQRVSVVNLPGRDNVTRINNLIQALNSGIPIAIGIPWPRFNNTYLRNQEPEGYSGHAITLVGYTSANGKIEDVVFIFKNSWGPTWGEGGYGQVTSVYLSRCAFEAVLLDVQRG